MKPKFKGISELEQMAADQAPSLEGAWWIMLQTANSIYNTAVIRDPVNNMVLNEFWQDISDAVVPLLKEDSIRPIPYDDIMQTIDYCSNQLHAVVKDPRHSIKKVDKKVMPYRLRNTSAKTMDWLGKQPGRTIKEKLAGKNKMLTVVNEYTYDVKENQVAMVLYKQIMKHIMEYINYGINLEGYDTGSESQSISKILRIKKEMRSAKLAEVKPVHHTKANNVLLADKNYSVLWKAYLDMCKYDTRLTKKWDKALQLFVQALFISINALLGKYKEVQVVEERINLQESLESKSVYVIGFKDKNPVVAELIWDREKVTLSLYKCPINNMEAVSKKVCYELIIDEKIRMNKLKAKHGCPLNVAVKKENGSETLNIFADMSGVYAVTQYCKGLIESYYKRQLHEAQEKNDYIEGTCVLDIVNNGNYFAVDNEKYNIPISNYVAVYMNKYGEKELCKTTSNSLYKDVENLIYVKDAIKKELQTEGLKNSLEEISKRVGLNSNDYFIYTIPDALEEFSQKNLKQCMHTWFPRTFPVWRSVAAISCIITDEEKGIEPSDIFISIDLMGETATAGLLTVKYEPKIKTYVCNHYPPFPENDLGDAITEEAFFENYIKKYVESRKINVSDAVIKQIINTGDMSKVLLKHQYINQTIIEDNGIKILRIEYDEEIARKCVGEWLSSFREFWTEVQKLLPDKDIQYANILSDCIMKYIVVDKVSNIISKGKNYKGTFVSDVKSISEGAYIYRDRLRGDHLPTWTEYLPQLSLEVIKDGQYKELALIGQDVSFDVMGECNEHQVSEKLILPAGKKEVRFPLKKEDISRNAAMIEAYVTDKSFPLQENITAELLVRYKYGFDNSYELILRPYNVNNPPFEEIVVEWQTGKRAPKVARYPIYPEYANENKILKDIERVSESLRRTKNTIERFIVNYEYENCSNLDFRRLSDDMTKQIFTIRNIIIHDQLPEVQAFINDFFEDKLLDYLGDLADVFQEMEEEEVVPNIFNRRYIEDKFFKDFGEDNSDFENVRCSAMQLIYCFGAKVPKDLQNFLINYYDKLDIAHKDNILLNMYYLNSNDTRISNIILREVQDSRKMDLCIKELSSLCWFDSQMILEIYNRYPGFIKEIIKYITKDFKEKAVKGLGRRGATKGQQKRYLRYVEMILAILRLRELEGFKWLIVDSKEARGLARNIRIVDEKMGHPSSKIRLKVDKPERLRNMSDVAYAVDMYLTGNEGVDSIEVVSVEAD